MEACNIRVVMIIDSFHIISSSRTTSRVYILILGITKSYPISAGVHVIFYHQSVDESFFVPFLVVIEDQYATILVLTPNIYIE